MKYCYNSAAADWYAHEMGRESEYDDWIERQREEILADLEAGYRTYGTTKAGIIEDALGGLSNDELDQYDAMIESTDPAAVAKIEALHESFLEAWLNALDIKPEDNDDYDDYYDAA
jgi:hypothetical protein